MIIAANIGEADGTFADPGHCVADRSITVAEGRLFEPGKKSEIGIVKYSYI
jgi:hypothetical protein